MHTDSTGEGKRGHFSMEWLIFMLLILLVVFAITLFVFVVYSGLSAEVNVSTGKPLIGAVVIAYKFSTGPYSNSGSIFSESTSIAPKKSQIGLYYDDPNKVPAQKLRWAVGAVISGADGLVDEKLWQAFEKEKFKQLSLPLIPTSVNCIFPHTTMISILLAVYRVYPAMGHYIQERALRAFPFLEVYEEGNIYFMAPLSEHKKFFVPEALTAEALESVRPYYTSEEQNKFSDMTPDSSVSTSEEPDQSQNESGSSQVLDEENADKEEDSQASGSDSDLSFEIVKTDD